MLRKENKRADALAALASTLSLTDQTQVVVCQRWVVPPPNDYEEEESKVEHLASILEGLDVVGPFPKSSGRHLYILIATDYFSKWAEAVSLKEVKKENVANFIRVNIIYHFGIPRYILTDNAILPLERQIPSLRLAIQEGLTDEENARLRLEELEALDEKRLEAQQSLECYQARLSRSFNKRVRLRYFQVGDQVLLVKKPIITSRRSGGKFSAKWDGPYIVQEVYSSGAYKIVDSEGLRICPVNGKFMKRYYP
ncbi:uncharacterized protein LOC142173763 [Nicotiana tabacum]|uniref:Uncharacterized protein LOC142173763 n=1 Tax=Nicotiana tabacum TaxID=4097 RepID=A0AC58TE51_TOBAC